MADYYGHARSNYFRVKNRRTFERALAKYVGNDASVWAFPAFDPSSPYHHPPRDGRRSA